MNFFRLSAIALLCLFLASCSDDDEADSPPDALEGTWSLTELTYKGSNSIPGPAGIITTNYNGEGFDMDLTVEFSANPNTFTSRGNYGIALNVESLGGSSTIELPSQSFFGSGNWTRDNDKLTITMEGEVEQQATILELNESTLRIAFDVSDMVVSLGAIDELDGTFVFTRQD